MNPPTRLEKMQRRNRGIALVIVISMVAILTVMTVAMLTLSDTERKTAVKFAEGESGASLADTAISIVMAQIWDGTKQTKDTKVLWASQPGAIRQYQSNGGFLKGYRLYSSPQMVVSTGGEQVMATDSPVTTWRTFPDQWVDINEPTVLPNPTSPTTAAAAVVTYPIFDPRAFITKQQTNGATLKSSANVEGFSYRSDGQWSTLGVIPSASVADTAGRLPMPVQWIYILQDGSLGSVTSNGGSGVSWQGTTLPTAANPMVGRIAFWTDDECCKININTASEPTPWAPPTVNYDLDFQWAAYPPTRFEYQRYPGHPATVAISTVLLPNQNLDTYGFSNVSGQALDTINMSPLPVGLTNTTQNTSVTPIKERIYDIMPKIAGGGSTGGTVPFWQITDPSYNGARQQEVQIMNAVNERLYASVDEMLYSQQMDTNGYRLTQDMVTYPAKPTVFLFPNQAISATGMSAMNSMNRVRAFLTANSRAPEVNMFGFPRVAMWPIADDKIAQVSGRGGSATDYRTTFDNLVAYCSSNGPVKTAGVYPFASYNYFFTRADPRSPTFDLAGIQRNRNLMTYLYNLMTSFGYPSGGTSTQNFGTKYGGPGAAQILTEIFDYIRCTNLYDGILAPSSNTLLSTVNTYAISSKSLAKPLTDAQVFTRRDNIFPQARTYTPQRAVLENTSITPPEDVLGAGFPGQGQVAPIQTNILSGTTTMGFGRFPTVTEVGFHFICTGDGQPDNLSWQPYVRNSSNKWVHNTNAANTAAPWSGGRTCYKINGGTAGPLNGAAQPVTPAKTEVVDPTSFLFQKWYSNYPFATSTTAPVPGTSVTLRQIYGTNATSKWDASLNPNGELGVPSPYFPGFSDASSWNLTLAANTPLACGNNAVDGLGSSPQRRIQGMLGIELTVVNSGWEGIYSDFCLKISGLGDQKIVAVTPGQASSTSDQALFGSLGNQAVIWHSDHSLFDKTDCRAAGGSAAPANLSEGRQIRGYTTNGMKMSADGQYVANIGTGLSYNAGKNFDLVTDFFTVRSDIPMQFKSLGPIIIEIHAGQDPGANLVQTVRVAPGSVSGATGGSIYLPVPELVMLSTPWVHWPDRYGHLQNAYATEAPHWWAFNFGGAVNRYTGSVTGSSSRDLTLKGLAQSPPAGGSDYGDAATLGRFYSNGSEGIPGLAVPVIGSLIWAYDPGTQYILPASTYTCPYPPKSENPGITTGVVTKGNFPTGGGSGGATHLIAPGIVRPFGQDVLFTMVPKIGDPRILAAQTVVDVGNWDLHPGLGAADITAGPNLNATSGGGAPCPKWNPITNTGDTFASSGNGNGNLISFVHHMYSRFNQSYRDAGFTTGEPAGNTKLRLVQGATYNADNYSNGYTPQTMNGKPPPVDWGGGGALPDLPAFTSTSTDKQAHSAEDAQRYGDFDNGIAGLRDGGWINKPDEGNSAVENIPVSNASGSAAVTRRVITAYFDNNWMDSQAGESYTTPNRMVSSPGMFGSLPTGIPINSNTPLLPTHGVTGNGALGVPWRTLLFHPYTKKSSNNNAESVHPGAPSYFGGTDPADHLIMDLFWMPVVEPYAISEPFSTAGKINMNYQIVPFNGYIRRATGMHAVLKGEIMGAFPTADASYYKNNPLSPASSSTNPASGPVVYTTYPKTGGSTYYAVPKYSAFSSSSPTSPTYGPNKFWYRRIEADTINLTGSTWASAVRGTLGQFDARFEFDSSVVGSQYAPPQSMGLFRTASQICEILLLPKKIPAKTGPAATVVQATTATAPLETATDGSDTSAGTPYQPADMPVFWEARGITGDNVRERPYANIYGKVTTQSNTYRVHYRVQTLAKARSQDPTKFDHTIDSVTSEYRGSALIERRIDPTSVNVDYATTPGSPPLWQFYSFRVLENKRFLP